MWYNKDIPQTKSNERGAFHFGGPLFFCLFWLEELAVIWYNDDSTYSTIIKSNLIEVRINGVDHSYNYRSSCGSHCLRFMGNAACEAYIPMQILLKRIHA